MKKNTITINGTTFELGKPVTSINSVKYGANPREIREVYGRPSLHKISIWEEWCKWANECDANLEIRGHNCNFFSIAGNVEHEGHTYNLWITYAHQRVFEVSQ